MSKENLNYFVKSVAETLSDKQNRVIEKYSSTSKLRAVMRWKERMARCNMTGIMLSEQTGISNTRLSEYINFQREPKDKRFLKIENAIYKRGA